MVLVYISRAAQASPNYKVPTDFILASHKNDLNKMNHLITLCTDVKYKSESRIFHIRRHISNVIDAVS